MADPFHASSGPAPKILVISDEMAWPLITGLRRRLAQSLTALASVGDVTWVACPRSGLAADPSIPAGLGQVRALVTPAPNRSLSGTARVWASSGLPWALAGADWADADKTLAEFSGTRFDLLWVAGVDAWLAANRAGISAEQVVMDSADIESEKLRLRLRSHKPSGIAGFARWLIGRIDIRRWRALEERAGDVVTAVCVCSADDAEAVKTKTWVVPNSYPKPGPQTIARSLDRLLFVGSLGYAPNIEGLEFFVRNVFNDLGGRNQSVTLRVVGQGLSSDHWIRRQPGVEVLEDVLDIGPEVAAATVVVVPLLWGGGTRLKIIEAFAFATPVVSTTVGAAGLDVVDGRQLVIADSAEDLVRACERLLGDAVERDRLGAAGRSHFEQHFDSAVIERQLASRIVDLLV